MEAGGDSGSEDYGRIAEALTALAYPLRLALLDALASPRGLAEIRVAPLRVEEGANPERPAAMSTVAGHLEKLVDAGFVLRTEPAPGGRHAAYVVNPQRLYTLVEDLRRLSTRHGGRGRGEDVTGTRADARPPAAAAGRRLVLVHGLYLGRSYALADATAADGGWIVGRAASSAVPLDYDSFVSAQNSIVERDGGALRIRDLSGKNGTSVNGSPLPRGGARPLARGDVVGVGRSLLVFYDS